MSPRRVTGVSTHAIEQFNRVDPGAGRYAVLSECERGRPLEYELALSTTGRYNLNGQAASHTPRDGYFLDRFGRVIFACVERRDFPDQLYCVTALRLSDSQREILRGMYEEPAEVTRRGERNRIANEFNMVDPAEAAAEYMQVAGVKSPFEDSACLVGVTLRQHVRQLAANMEQDVGHVVMDTVNTDFHRGVERRATPEHVYIWFTQGAPRVSDDGRHFAVNIMPLVRRNWLSILLAKAASAGIQMLETHKKHTSRQIAKLKAVKTAGLGEDTADAGTDEDEGADEMCEDAGEKAPVAALPIPAAVDPSAPITRASGWTVDAVRALYERER